MVIRGIVVGILDVSTACVTDLKVVVDLSVLSDGVKPFVVTDFVII